MTAISEERKKRYRIWATIVSVAIPLVVALLFGIRIDGVDLGFLPSVYASINGLTAIILIAAYIAIKKRKKELHKRLIFLSLSLSFVFLVMYVAYHITSDSTPYGGEGTIRYLYFSLLISHIFLSVAVVPLVLFTLLRALLGEYTRHRKLARVTFPIWLYVAISGVVVYLMISPYY